VAANEGRGDDAYQSLIAAVRLDRCLASEPTVIGVLVRIASQSACGDAIGNVICLCGLSDSQLAELQKEVTAFAADDAMPFAMLSERASMAETFAWIYSGRGSPTAVAPIGGVNPLVTRWMPALGQLERKAVLDIMTRFCRAARLPPPEAAKVAEMIDADSRQLPKYYTLASIMIPSLSNAIALGGRTRGEMAATLAAIAAERFRLRRGRCRTIWTNWFRSF